MLVFFNYSNIFQGLLSWFRGRLPASRSRGAGPALDPGTLVPSLFVRRSTAVRPPVDAWAFSVAGVLRRALAGRLRTVALRNVPRVRVGMRRKTVSPARKPVPSKAPRVLKRYKQERVTGAFSLTGGPRSPTQVPLVTAGVVPLASGPKRRRVGVSEPVPAERRLAA
jgi:hypothetical protein